MGMVGKSCRTGDGQVSKVVNPCLSHSAARPAPSTFPNAPIRILAPFFLDADQYEVAFLHSLQPFSLDLRRMILMGRDRKVV